MDFYTALVGTRPLRSLEEQAELWTVAELLDQLRPQDDGGCRQALVSRTWSAPDVARDDGDKDLGVESGDADRAHP